MQMTKHATKTPQTNMTTNRLVSNPIPTPRRLMGIALFLFYVFDERRSGSVHKFI